MVLIAASACSRNALDSIVEGYDPQVASGIRDLRDATRPFNTIDSAVAVGYTRQVRDCLVHEHHGAMGYHHTNPADFHPAVQCPASSRKVFRPSGT